MNMDSITSLRSKPWNTVNQTGLPLQCNQLERYKDDGDFTQLKGVSMRALIFKVVVLLAFLLMAVCAQALVSEYTFSSNLGTYTEITGGTVLGDNTNDDESFNAIPLGFTFSFNGAEYSEISVQTDAFLAFGSSVLNSTLAISSPTGTNNIASALNRDLMSRPDGELSYLLTGTTPNRVFVVQWKNYRRILSTAVNDIFNFQIQLHESNNAIIFAYGTFSLVTLTTAPTVQVGLRGDSNADFNNRATTTNWAATTAGTAANATCALNATVYPPDGLKFIFAPTQVGPPSPAQLLYPADGEMDVEIGTNLGWTSGGGTLTGYKVFLGTDNPPTNIVNGAIQTGTVYDPPADLSYSTLYYWQIVPYNDYGDAIGCPVWSFTTLADPTITAFPYNQNFDTLPPPALPLGWTVLNLNNDPYTWISVADANANTPPNAMRIRYNETMAMNDWLITPPLQFSAGSLYRISFYYRGGSANSTERLALLLGTAPTADAMATQLFADENITSTTYQMAEVILPVTASGINYLGFKGYSSMGMYHLYLDTFSIQEIGPDFAIDPASHDFGEVNIGESANQVFTISNTGGGILTITGIAITGNPMFSLGNLPPLPLDLGMEGESTFTVVFAPTAAGEQLATLIISDDLARMDHAIALVGTGFLLEDFNPPTNLEATVTGNDVHLAWSLPVYILPGGLSVLAGTGSPATRALIGYKVFRDGELISAIGDPSTLAYDDWDLAEGTYAYTVSAIYTSGESVPAGPVQVTILEQLYPPTQLEGFVDDNDVTLNWTSPYPPLAGEWLTWANDVIGNTVGTNQAAQFIIAQRWDQTDLADYQGDSIVQVKFVPAYENCVYTVKIWTGGSALDPGTLVASQIAGGIVINEWNPVLLTQAVPIPAVGDLWVGIDIATQGGYPAAVDFGPAVEGKGNMMYFNGVWTTLPELSSTLVCNWLIAAYAAEGVVRKHAVPAPIEEAMFRGINHGSLAFEPAPVAGIRDLFRALVGFKVYRDGILIANLTNPYTTTYMDLNLADGAYLYGVSAVYSSGESEAAETNIVVNTQMAPVLFSDSFESYPNFTHTFAPWTLLDLDLSETYGFSGVDFPGNGTPSAFVVFNPAATLPPMQNLTVYDGAKMLACFAATSPPNNDWLITPRIHLGTGSKLRFYARSHTSIWGLERIRVGVSTLGAIVPDGFLYLTGNQPVEVPTSWTEYTFDLAGYDNQQVFIGIRCVSNDAYVLYVDKFSVHSEGGSVAGDDPALPGVGTGLRGNHPNPFSSRTTICYSLEQKTPVSIQIYNIRGQLVRSLVQEVRESGEHSVAWNGTDNNGQRLGSGIYYCRMQAGKHSSIRKMILMN